MTLASESKSEKNRMVCAKRSENQVRGDREDNSATINLDYASQFTVNRELTKWHGSSNNGMKTRALTARETARPSKDFLIRKSSKPPTTKLSIVEEDDLRIE